MTESGSDPQSAIHSARNVALATMLSRIFGLIRDKITVFVFTKSVADALLLAWTIPNLFRRLFGEGALAAALVPVLAEVEKEQGTKARDCAASAVVTALIAFLGPLLLLLWLGLWQLPEQFFLRWFESESVGRTTRMLLQWMLPYLLLICVAAQLQGLANLAGRFFVPALSPALLNLLWIISALGAYWFSDGDPIWVASGVLLGGVLQIVLQTWELHRVGVHLSPTSIFVESVRRVVRRALPMVLGLARQPDQLAGRSHGG